MDDAEMILGLLRSVEQDKQEGNMATLREIQLCQLDIMKTVSSICDRHNIPYYLAYGTFLGAVRHEGFIPWDDDVDIYMRYDDLKKFKKICKKELPKKYFFQDPDTDIAAHWLFPKIRANGTNMSEWYVQHGVHANFHEGIWIDIFPLLDTAETPEKIEQQVSSIFAYQHDLFLRQPIKKHDSLRQKFDTFRTNVKGKIVLHRHKKKFEKLQSEKSDFAIVMGNLYIVENTEENRKKAVTSCVYKNEMVSKMYAFEDAAFSGMLDYDTYLARVYGEDYMTPKKWSHIQDYSHVTID